MGPTGKIAVVGVAGLLTLSALGLLPAQEPPPAPAPPLGLATPQDEAVLLSHALGMAIGGTQTQLAARQLAASPARKGSEGEGALEQLREQARASYEASSTLLQQAKGSLDRLPLDTPSRQLYEAVVAYTKTLWDLAGRAAPVDEAKAQTKDTGDLGVADVAAMQVINNAVHQAAEAYLLKQLTLRMDPARDATARSLAQHSGKMASASEKGSAKFPKVAKSRLEEARAKVASAKSKEEAAAGTLKAVQEAGKVGDQFAQNAAKGIQKQAKQAKKAAAKDKESAEEALDKAKAAVKAGVGEGVESPSVGTLAQRGRVIILILHQMTETPAEEVTRKAQEKGQVVTGKEAAEKVKKAEEKAKAARKEIQKGIEKIEKKP